MAIKHPSNVREAAANKPTAGGVFTLSGVSAGDKRTFAAALSTGDQCPVHATNGTDWMDFLGSFTDGSPSTLTVTTVLESSTGSAIDWSGGGTVTLVVGWPGSYAEQTLRIVQTPFLHVQDMDGTKYALLPLDANGNVEATLAHRQNTLANLLALDGLAGEISVATDVDALVVHDGTVGGAVAYMRSREFLALAASTTTASISSGVDATVTGWTEHADPLSAFDATTGVFTTPTGYQAIEIIATCDWDDASQGSSSVRRLFVQFEAFPGVWLDYSAPKTEMSVAGYKTSMYCITLPVAVTGGANKKLRLVLRQNSGAAFIANVGWQIRLIK